MVDILQSSFAVESILVSGEQAAVKEPAHVLRIASWTTLVRFLLLIINPAI